MLACEKLYKYTKNEIRFCDAIVYKSMSQYDAYRYAYGIADNVPRENIDACASRVSNKVKNITRLGELRAKLEERKQDTVIWTFEDSVRDLILIKERSTKETDAINAIKELNSMYGFNKQNIDLKNEIIGDFKIEVE